MIVVIAWIIGFGFVLLGFALGRKEDELHTRKLNEQINHDRLHRL